MPGLTAEPFATRFESQPRKKEGPVSLMPFFSRLAAVLGEFARMLILEEHGRSRRTITRGCVFHSILSHSSQWGLFHSIPDSGVVESHDLNTEFSAIL